MIRPFATRTLGVFSALVLVSCFGDSTGPGELRSGRLSLVPTFHSASHLVDFDQVRIRLTRAGSSTLVLDTLINFPAGVDSIELRLDVPVVDATETLSLVMDLIDQPSGNVVFTIGPTDVIASVAVAQPQVLPPFLYVGPGANAVGIRFVSTPTGVFFSDTAIITAEAFGTDNAAIPGTPIAWSVADTSRLTLVSDSAGRVVGRVGRGAVGVTASLLRTSPTAEPPSVTHSILLQPRPAQIVVQLGDAQTGAVGATLAPITARVLANDQLGVAGVPVTFAVVSGGGSLSAPSDTSDANGDVSVTWTLGATVGGQVVNASITGLAGATVGFNATATPGTAVRVQFESNPANVDADSVITPAITVRAYDEFGNAIPGFAAAVTVALLDNPGGASLGGTVTRTPVGGVATFNDLTVSAPGTGYTLLASSGTLASDTSAAFDVAASAPTRLTFEVQPANSPAGTAITPAIEVALRTDAGTLVTSATNAVTLSLADNPGGATLGGTLTVNAVGGIATFSNVVLDRPATGYTLAASAAGMIPDTSTAFNVVAGPATVLIFTTQPPTSALFDAPFVVAATAHDAAGNPATDYTGAVTLQIANNPAGGALYGTLTVNAVAGVATFSGIEIDNVGAGYTLAVNATGLAGTASGSMDVVAPASINAWINTAGGNWSNAANWSRGTVPVSTDTVVIRQTGTYTVNFDQSATVGAMVVGGRSGQQTLMINANTLTSAGDGVIFSATGRLLLQSSGIITGPGGYEVFGAFQWVSGSINASGGAGQLLVQPGATMTITNTPIRILTDYTVAIAGLATWTDIGTIHTGSGARLRVENLGTLEIEGDGQFVYNQGGAVPAIEVMPGGVLTRSVSTGTFMTSGQLNNGGTVHVLDGILEARGGGTSSGNWNIPLGATLAFTGGTSNLSGGTVTGAGNVLLGAPGGVVNAGGGWIITGTTQINAGTLNANGAVMSSSNLNLTAGVLGGSGLMGVGTAMSWSGGSMAGAGGTVRSLVGSSLAISGTGGRTFTNMTLEVQGTATWADAQTVNTGVGAVLRVSGGATLDIQGDPNLTYNQGGAVPVVHNQGTINRTTSAGVALISAAFENDGLVSASTGTLRLMGGTGAGTADGTYDAAAGATIDFGGGTHGLGVGSAATGAGTILVSGAVVNAGGPWSVAGATQILGGTLNYNAGSGTIHALAVSGGVLGGGVGGLLQVENSMVWTSGNLAGGGGTTQVQAGASLAIFGTAGRTFTNYTLDLLGAGTWTEAAVFNSGAGAVLHVAPGASLDIQGNPNVPYNQGGAQSRLHNEGTLTRSTSTGVATIAALFENDGNVSVTSGTLRLTGGNGGGGSDGSYAVASPGVLEFNGGVHTLTATSSLSGDGTAQVSSGTVNANGNWAHGGLTRVTGGALNYSAAGGSTENLEVVGGSLGGTAPGVLTVTTGMRWGGGNLAGTGGTVSVAASGSLLIDSTIGRTFTNYTIDLAGPGIWSGNATYNSGAGAVLRVSAGGTLDITGDPVLAYNQGGAQPLVHNLGTILRSTSDSVATLSAAFDNDALVSVASGTLRLLGGSGASSSDGTWMTSAAGTLDFGGGTHNLGAGGQVTGDGMTQASGGVVNAGGGWSMAGVTQVAGGTLNFNAGGMSTAALNLMSGQIGGGAGGLIGVSGTLAWSGGNMQGSGGTARVLPGGMLNVTGAAGRTFTNYTLENQSPTSAWSSTATFNTGAGAVFHNAAGATLTIDGSGSLAYNQGGALPVFSNAGTLVKTAGTNLSIAMQFVSTGLISLPSGQLMVTGGGSLAGNMDVTLGALFQVNGGTVNLAHLFTASGGGALELAGGTLAQGAITDTAYISNLQLPGGVLSDNGVVHITAGAEWSGGAIISGAGKLLIDPGALLTIFGTAGRTFTNGTIENQGTANWSGALTVNTGGGAVLLNAPGGVFNLTGSGPFAFNQGGVRTRFINQGAFVRSGSATASNWSVAMDFEPTAQVSQILTGGLVLTGGGVWRDTLDLGADIELAAGTWTFHNGQAVTGASAVNFTGGTIVTATASDTARFQNLNHLQGVLGQSGVVRVAGLLNWSNSGAINGTGTTLVPAGATMVLSGTIGRSFVTGTIQNNGTINWPGTLTLNTGSGAVIRNAGAFSVTGGGSVSHNQGGTFTFDNTGSFTLNTTGAFPWGGLFQDTVGTLNVAAGTLQLGGSSRWGTGVGKNVSAGAGIELSSGQHSFRPGTVFSGTGLVNLLGGTLTADSGSVLTPVSFVNLTLTGGTYEHEGMVDISTGGTLHWAGTTGIRSNTTGQGGTTRILSGAQLLISGAASRTFVNPHTILNNGTVTFLSTASIFTGGGAVIQNNGVFDFADAGSILLNQGGTATFNNAPGATLRRSTNPGTAILGMVMNKQGPIDLQTGILRLNQGSVTNFAGAVNGAGSLELAGGTFTLTGPMTAAGNVDVSAGNLVINGQLMALAANFATSGAGLLTMTNAADSLGIAGSATFGGVSTNGTLTNGIITVNQNFSQAGSATSYFPTAGSPHRLHLRGTTQQNISFAAPTSSRFNRLTIQAAGRNVILLTNAEAVDSLHMLAGAQAYQLQGPAQRLRVGGLRLEQQTSSPSIQVLALELSATPSIAPIAGLQADSTIFLPGVAALPTGDQIVYNHIRVATGAAFTMPADTIPGTFSVSSGNAQFGFTGTFMANKFFTGTGGQFSMTAAGTNIIVADSALFFGGSTAGLLTTGNLLLRGNFVQGGNGAAFAPSGTHMTTIASPGTTPASSTIFFTNPATSFFNNVSFNKGNSPPQGVVTLLSNARATGTASVVNSTHLTGPGQRMRVDGVLTATISTISPIINNLLALELGATPTVNINATADTIVFIGTIGAMPVTGFTYNNVRVGAGTVTIPAANIANNFVVSGGTASFNDTVTVTIGGDLITHGLGAFSQTAAGRVIVVGDASFGGGTSTAINNGVLEVRGNFSQIGVSSTASFQANGAHVTNLSGGVGANRQAISFTTPGTGAGSRFAFLQLGRVVAGSSAPVAIELLTDIHANRLFDTSSVGVDTIFANSQTQILTADSLSVSDQVYNGARLQIGNIPNGGSNGTASGVGLRFINMIATQTWITLTRFTGQQVSLQGLEFPVLPVGGLLLNLTTTSGSASASIGSTVADTTACPALVSRTGAGTGTITWNGQACP